MDPNKRDVFVIWKQYIIELAFLAAEEKVFGGGKKPNKNFVSLCLLDFVFDCGLQPIQANFSWTTEWFFHDLWKQVEYYNEQLAKTIESTFEARLRRLLFDLDDLNDDFQGLFQTAVDQALHEVSHKYIYLTPLNKQILFIRWISEFFSLIFFIKFDFKKLTQWHCCTHNPVVTTKIREKLEEHLKKLEQILKHKTRPKNPKIRCSKWRWFPKSQRSRYESLGP